MSAEEAQSLEKCIQLELRLLQAAALFERKAFHLFLPDLSSRPRTLFPPRPRVEPNLCAEVYEFAEHTPLA